MGPVVRISSRVARLAALGAAALLAAAPSVPAATRAPAPGWSLRKIGAPAAWRDLTSRSRPVVIAVLDSGLDPHDPALAGAVVPGHDFVQGGADTSDDFGHGTLVAGVIAGRGSSLRGACPRCRVMPIRVIDATGHASAAAIAAGIAWAVDHGAAVVNMSFVMPTTDPGIAAAVSDALAHGVVLVAGAGNGGPGAAVYPAAYPGVVGVGASDQADRLEPWSGSGAWVSVAAPGCTRSVGVGGGAADFCGTSSATALVSGVIGLGLAVAPAAGSAGVLAALAATADPVAGGGVAWGRVDAASLLRYLLGPATRVRVPQGPAGAGP